MTEAASPGEAAAAAFGKENRARLIDRYFTQAGAVTPANAWRHVYALLLWIDPTTNLAHCYESDKSQPGRHWYGRTLKFHDWLCSQFGGIQPRELQDHIDWLFREASAQMALMIRDAAERLAQAAARQLLPYAGRDFPEAGLDPDLQQIILDVLRDFLPVTPSESVLAQLTSKIHEYMRAENKRRNLLGEGFEDVLAQIIRRLPPRQTITVETRQLLHQVPGFFTQPRGGDKPKRVDIILGQPNGWRSLVTAKWSTRADREEQFVSDYAAYVGQQQTGTPFEYAVITNEFDPARLVAACERVSHGRLLFTTVVHVNPDALLVVYDTSPKKSQAKVVQMIQSQRLVSLERWLATL